MKKEFKAKLIFYFDECIVFLFMLVAIIASDIIHSYIKGKAISGSQLRLDPISIGIAVFIAIISYGRMYNSFNFKLSESGELLRKEPLIKRISEAILQGIAWKTIIDTKEAF